MIAKFQVFIDEDFSDDITEKELYEREQEIKTLIWYVLGKTSVKKVKVILEIPWQMKEREEKKF